VQYYDHALLGATLALATGAQRRHGWPIVLMAAAAAALPDWDVLPRGVPAPAGYRSVHRVWGHNLLVATLLSGLVGALGYLIWLSARRSSPDGGARARRFSGHALAVWTALAVLAVLSHLLADVCYCGVALAPEWPVALLWPFSERGAALPLVSLADHVLTWLLAVTLLAAGLRPSAAQGLGALALLVSFGYVAAHGLFLTAG
jgi:membrane-bound metal-dependent hydrolase YbcI (DUF457 family)